MNRNCCQGASILFATTNGLDRSAVPNWGRSYHGNATKRCGQSEVEGTHVSEAACPIVRRAVYEMRGKHTRENMKGVNTRSCWGIC
jgi:hypothetical protein